MFSLDYATTFSWTATAIAELGLEREGLRDYWLAVSVKRGIEGGEEEDYMAGIYLMELP